VAKLPQPRVKSRDTTSISETLFFMVPPIINKVAEYPAEFSVSANIRQKIKNPISRLRNGVSTIPPYFCLLKAF
jgi:hypothetical protein